MSRAYPCLIGLLLILVISESLATTLGEINVLSAVGEPFSATIEVQLSGTDSADQMIARIASPDTHTAFGIPYEYYSSTINVEIVQRKEKLLLVLVSTKDLREVYFEFIFQLRFITGSIYRAYSVLPEFNVPQMGGAGKNVERASWPRRKITAGSYTVVSRDSLWLIAAAMDRSLGSVTQRISLLEAANPALKNGEIHSGDTLVIPADSLPIPKPAPVQKREPSTKVINEPVIEIVKDLGNVPDTVIIEPTLASEKELAAVARRATGYRIVRLTAVSGPQFSQSLSGVATFSKDNNDTKSLELEKIRENLESLSRENATLTSDIRRLEAQNQQWQRESKEQQRYPQSGTQTDIQPADTLLAQERQPKVSVDEETNRESDGISKTVMFFLSIIFIGLVGITLWLMRRRREHKEAPTEASAIRYSAENVENVNSAAPIETALTGLMAPSADQGGVDLQSPDFQTQIKATSPTLEDLPTPDKTVNIFPSKDVIDFITVDRPVIDPEPISDANEPNDPAASIKFSDLEFVEELEQDEPEPIDLDFELELEFDQKTASIELNDETFELLAEEEEEEDKAKSMNDVFEDLHLLSADHERTTSSSLVGKKNSGKNDSGLTGKVARWAELQQEWDDAIASGTDIGQSLAMVYIELDDMANIEDKQGPMRTEGLISQAQNLLTDSIQAHDKSLHRIKDHTFLFLSTYNTETELRERGKSLVRIIQDHEFVVRNEHLTLSLSVGIVPFTTLFNTLDDYLRCGKMTVAELRTELAKSRISGGVAIHFEGSHEAEDWENEEEFLTKVNELLQANMFDVEYQTLINLSGNQQQVYMCKTELSPEVDTQALPTNFLKKAFTCNATPAIERQSITIFMDKIRSLGDDSVQMLFRIDIRSAMDPKFGDWLFEQLEVKGIDPTSITLFVYADDVIAHKPHIMTFAAKLRQHGSRLGILNVDYDGDHLQAALDVGASIVRINPSIVDDVVESSVRFGSRPVTSGTRESSRFKDFLTSFQKRNIETVLFSTYVEAIPGLVVLNATNLRASYIQTPIGMIEDDLF
ncbi:MAG: EAL domain-containing protein (putative c-di-GMP-specific phosphodiesterase class I) [Candidatus Azotimanducaceae bacterium]|jgi:EAL domain-containing protein (putative c-di-GMP-specific phosphodiesterase class I)/GGDEF domain-containing protein